MSDFSPVASAPRPAIPGGKKEIVTCYPGFSSNNQNTAAHIRISPD
jgi:hypothetical protein